VIGFFGRNPAEGAAGKVGRVTPTRIARFLLAAVAVLVAHTLAYLLAYPSSLARETALTGHAYLGSLSAVVIPAALGALVWFAITAARRSGLHSTELRASHLALLQAVLFVTQEVIERAGTPELGHLLGEPTLWLGLALQLPVAWVMVWAVGFGVRMARELLHPQRPIFSSPTPRLRVPLVAELFAAWMPTPTPARGPPASS